MSEKALFKRGSQCDVTTDQHPVTTARLLRPIGCKLFMMIFGQSLRARWVMVLAVFAVLCSDPAVVELACAGTTGCPHHAGAQQAAPGATPEAAKTVTLIAGAKSCCPGKRIVAWRGRARMFIAL